MDAAHHRREPVTPAAGLAYENERLQRLLRTRLDEQEALRRVALLVAQQHAPEELFALVAEEVARHLDADAAMVARYGGPGAATVIADWSAPGLAPFPVGQTIELGEETSLARVQATGAPARVDSYAELEGTHSEQLRELGMEAGVAAPIVVDGRLWGAVAAGTAGTPFAPGAESRLGAFAELLAQSIANAEARILLNRSRARIVQAGDDARRAIERDLHDGAQQRLVGLALSMRLLANRLEPERKAELDACIAELREALQDLRELARGIHPAVLTDRGLHPALHALASRCSLPVAVDADPAAAGCPPRRRRRCTSSPPRRSRTSTSTPAPTPRRSASSTATAGSRSRSPTTASAAPGRRTAAGCAASPTGSTRSAGTSPSTAGPAPAPPCARACPSSRPDARRPVRARAGHG